MRHMRRVRGWGRVLSVTKVLVALAMLSGTWLAGCEKKSPGTDTSPPGRSPADSSGPSPAPAPADAVHLVFPYGSEKKLWLAEATESFNRAGHTTPAGRAIHVQALPMGSGESVREILDGRLEAHLLSPASMAWVELGNAESR